ncbi:6851_t:CDS:2 [Funneliformis caledonium]|uniref:6851_t:CDS:1 n=1 Tax=Funneliformis caledonium TaxID=1117310 RepID=A0A9N8VLL5_9GLOM|nr:6851_t:CDS:2 [Funneliformis caledonium]
MIPAGLNVQLIMANIGTDALVIPRYTVFNKDWMLAGDKLTSKVVCTPNANLPNRIVVLADITLRQLIDYFKRNYSIIARHANMEDNKFCRRFIEELSSDNQIEIHHIGLSKPIDEIFLSLKEIESYKAELLSSTNPLLQSQ